MIVLIEHLLICRGHESLAVVVRLSSSLKRPGPIDILKVHIILYCTYALLYILLVVDWLIKLFNFLSSNFIWGFVVVAGLLLGRRKWAIFSKVFVYLLSWLLIFFNLVCKVLEFFWNLILIVCCSLAHHFLKNFFWFWFGSIIIIKGFHMLVSIEFHCLLSNWHSILDVFIINPGILICLLNIILKVVSHVHLCKLVVHLHFVLVLLILAILVLIWVIESSLLLLIP